MIVYLILLLHLLIYVHIMVPDHKNYNKNKKIKQIF